MIEKIIKKLLGSSHKRHYRSYSSSDFRRRPRKSHPNKYGHHHYKRKGKSSFFSSFYSS
ncbi:hypothetical protein LC040_07960 [Bacillus tianshenii]|nr:hypothetical protein LC040_07960 [Bacillus tianshenii]